MAVVSSPTIAGALGDFTFFGTAGRIKGDMSNATFANRLAFQTTTTNGATRFFAMPNGTGTAASFALLNSSDPANASWTQLDVSATACRLNATNTGTGTLLPLHFLTNNTVNAILDTGGGFTISPSTAVPAGGTAGVGLKFSSATNLGVFFGSGAPTLSAAKGSLYLRTDGSGTSDRMYVNTDGSTAWTAVTTAT